MTRAHAYLRCSSATNVNGDSFERQLAAIGNYAAAHDIKIVDVYREEAVAGNLDLDNRPALMSLVERMSDGGDVKLVLIEKLDRLARDLMVQEAILADFKKRDLTIISATEGDLLDADPSRVFIRQIFGAIAQLEKTLLIAKLKGARERKKAKTGRCEGQKPFGHYAGENAILDRIRLEWAAGGTYTSIARELNAKRIPTRKPGARWSAMTVLRIIKRDEYKT